MSFFDGTGPLGHGPRTGRGLGPCGLGSGRGFGRGFGFGLGRGSFGAQKNVVKDLKEYKEALKGELKATEEELAELPKEGQ